MSGKLAITLKRSTIGSTDEMKATVRGLGLRRLHQTVMQPDNPSTRGAAFKIRHLIEVRECVEGEELVKPNKAPSAVLIALPKIAKEKPLPEREASAVVEEEAGGDLPVAEEPPIMATEEAPVEHTEPPTVEDQSASEAEDANDDEE